MKQRGRKQRRYTKKDLLIDLEYIGVPILMLGISWITYITIYYIIK